MENRSKPTQFRGTILIHASRTVDVDAGVSEEEERALREAGILREGDEDYLPWTGAIIGMVDIVDCVRQYDTQYFEGPVGWVLANPVRFDRPIEWSGKQGIFYVPREVLCGTPADSVTPGSGGPSRARPAERSSRTDEPGRKRYWVWVTGPDYYLDEHGFERAGLEPDAPIEDGSWWTCHRNTRRGDLIMLYRTRPKQDIAYLIEAQTSARILESERPEHALSFDEWVELIQDAPRAIQKFAGASTSWLRSQTTSKLERSNSRRCEARPEPRFPRTSTD